MLKRTAKKHTDYAELSIETVKTTSGALVVILTAKPQPPIIIRSTTGIAEQDGVHFIIR